MKAKIWIVLLLAFSCLIIDQVYAIDNKSVVAIWLFDENAGNVARDYSGNGHNGEIKGSVKWIAGKFLSALEFPGTDGNFVLVPHDNAFNLTTFSMSVWIKAENTGNRQEIIMKRKQGATNSQNLHFQIESGKTSVDVGFTVDGQWATGLFGQKSVTDGDWHHVVATYNKEALKIYADGVIDGQQARNTKPDNNDASVTIGAVFDAGNTPLKGSLDDIGIFNTALKEEDIVKIMNDGLKKTFSTISVSNMGKLTSTWGGIKIE